PAAGAEPAPGGLPKAAARLGESGLGVDPAAARVRPAVPEDEWRDAWKRYFHVVRVAPRIVIVPSWETYQPAVGDVVLDLDPGRAFGTGAHASTRLCLRELDDLEAAGQAVERFLDVGTGSGILAIAAAKLWPRARGVAVDVDPVAVDAARENLERNGIRSVAASDDDLGRVEGTFDVIVSNIQADVLEHLAPALVARLREGGALLLSGLLTHQVAPVAEIFEALGLRRDRIRALDEDADWSAVLLRR